MRTFSVAPMLTVALLVAGVSLAPKLVSAEVFAVEVLHGSTVTLVRGAADGSRSEVVTRADPVPEAREDEQDEPETPAAPSAPVPPVVQIYESPSYPAYGFVPAFGRHPHRKLDRHPRPHRPRARSVGVFRFSEPDPDRAIGHQGRPGRHPPGGRR